MTRYIRKEQEGYIKGRGTTEQVFVEVCTAEHH